ncbi:MAG: hypothetical protein E7659_00330 [Ruminococcaceae bacterium]|nr:hypothetical protein [Oscillospiraceae bacterium]
MDYNDYNDYSWMEYPKQPKRRKKREWRCSLTVLLALLSVAIVATMMLTFTLTSKWVRAQDSEIIAEQQQTIDVLRDTLKDDSFTKLQILASLLEEYSYYSNQFDKEQMLDQVMRAYTEATGDNYAAYYTDEEYAALSSDNAGAGVGIGVSVVQEPLVVEGQEFLTFNIITIFKNAPAQKSNLRVGDSIYAIEIDGEYKSVAQLGGYTPALNAIRGEIGSTAKLLAFRPDKNGGYEIIEAAIVRNTYTKESVTYRVSETDASVGIVHLSEFDLQTPVQFKEAVKALQAKGVEHFIFDVRNNPGGDLQSIKAVLSFLLEDGKLILTAVDNKGRHVNPVYAGAESFSGTYAPCSVEAEEVGMFANLDMVVLCNGNTASAAEVFTASLRDHKNVTIVGETTFGKGIMQRYYSLSNMTAGAFDGYVKMTTHAYVTACGVTYHDIGIAPTEGYAVELSEEALEYHFYLLPEHLDNQLQKAIEAVKNN